MMKIFLMIPLFILALSGCASRPLSTLFCDSGNLHLVDEDKESGFALYRSGWPSEKEVKRYCDLGVSEEMVLSGNWEEMEGNSQNRSKCPTLKAVYNEEQSVDSPLTEAFLSKFDEWISDARKAGKKVLVRCNCGSHRTGRLIAYYELKYKKMSCEKVKDEATEKGHFMWAFPQIYQQIEVMCKKIGK